MLAWLFPTGVTTHVLLTAGPRNPTVRLRFLAARTLLADYGRPGFHQELLALLGCAELPRERVERHLTAMTAAFDTAAAVAATPFPFSSDITPAARPVAVDGSRDLIDRVHHREAVFWIAATYARCLAILASDAPAAAPGHTPGFSELLGDLGIASRPTWSGGPGRCATSCPGSGGSPRRSWPRTRTPATDRPAVGAGGVTAGAVVLSLGGGSPRSRS